METKLSNEFRLIGMIAGGSIPLVYVFLIALSFTVVIRIIFEKLSAQFNKRKEVCMKKTNPFKIINLTSIESIWAIGVNCSAGALSS